MQRRNFLRLAGLASTGLVLPAAVSRAFAQSPADRWRTFEVTTRVEVVKPAGKTRVWLPTPLTVDTPYQKSLGSTFKAEGAEGSAASDPAWGLGMVWTEWAEGAKPVLTLVSRFATRDVAVDLTKPRKVSGNPAELAQYLKATEFLPTDGIVKDTAMDITKGTRGDVEKARALYEWICDNTFRDPKTRGCGEGDIKYLLETKNLSGKCADLNSLYVGLARAVGLPARDVYGIRVAKSEYGYKSLGAGTENITKAQHCRAEVFLNGYGWVPVDPADVRKVVLEEPPGNLRIGDEKVTKARARLFGSWEMNWLAYNFAHDVALPGAAKGRIPFFMYPQCETADGRLDSLDPDNFRYQITAREI
ncbi:MAG: transglutaminase domain-containing protein [Betaproteobacteria bacterium]|nr:transglutaminase domain-containing protein [Betaproteobacteria bacterium]